MRLRYHQLVGKQVVTSDGRSLGTIVDLFAERQGDVLRVTALHVGLTALVRRISFRRAGAIPLQVQRIPWRFVTRIDRHVHLGIDSANLHGLPVTPADGVQPEPPP